MVYQFVPSTVLPAEQESRTVLKQSVRPAVTNRAPFSAASLRTAHPVLKPLRNKCGRGKCRTLYVQGWLCPKVDALQVEVVSDRRVNFRALSAKSGINRVGSTPVSSIPRVRHRSVPSQSVFVTTWDGQYPKTKASKTPFWFYFK